jgi:SPP1 family predicted phage head-tail adaptor
MSAKTAQRPSRIGELRERVGLYDFTETDDGFGNFIQAWALAASVWARIEPLRGAERYQAAALETVVSWHIHIRRRTDITNDWRIVKGTMNEDGEPIGASTIYRIVNILNPDERGRFLQIEAETLQ